VWGDSRALYLNFCALILNRAEEGGGGGGGARGRKVEKAPEFCRAAH